MDPNATLDRMRAAIQSLYRPQAADPEHAQAFHEIADCAESLDRWLRMGGALPNDWDEHNAYKQAKGR